MSVKRYEWMACDEHACHCDVVESAEGDMVDYEDYAALEQKLAESQREFRAADATIENLQMQLNAEREAKLALAAENAGLKNSSACTLQDGRPPHGFYASEWFIAKLKNGEYAALKALPEEYSHDYRTNDGTYYTKDWVVGWMQTPDTEYLPNVKTPATDAFLAEARVQGVEMFGELTIKIGEEEDDEDIVYAGRQALLFAAQLRKGVQS